MLPIKTNPEDAESVVAYLRTKPAGATVKEAQATLEKRLLDGRKLSAYRTWDLLSEEEGKLKLTPKGRELSMNEKDRAPIYLKIIRGVRAYRMAVEWMHHQPRSEVLSEDLAAHWHEHMPEEQATTNETTMRDQAACFFQLAEAAGLGKYLIGRGKTATRLEVSASAVADFATREAHATELEVAPDGADKSEREPEGLSVDVGGDDRPEEEEKYRERTDPRRIDQGTRVFISHGKNTSIVDQVKTMLDVTKMDYEIAVERETAAIPVPDKVLDAMRRSTAAIICVTADAEAQKDDGTFSINENVLIEIGAAFVLYDKKVVLVWDRRLEVPSNLQGLYRCEFEGDELSWAEGVKLMKALSDFED